MATKFPLFDIDGVIANFTHGACKLHGKPVKHPDNWNFHHAPEWGFKDNEAPFWSPMGRAFWAGLEPLADGVQLLNLTASYVPWEQIAFLTSPAQTDGCIDGKRDWVKQHFPHMLNRTFPTSEKDYLARIGGRNVILIDDSDGNVKKFAAAGGSTLLIPRPWNARARECDEEGHFHVGRIQDELRAML